MLISLPQPVNKKPHDRFSHHRVAFSKHHHAQRKSGIENNASIPPGDPK
jgi:hypothetical protein